MRLKRIVTWVSGPLLAAFFLWLCFRSVDLDELLAGIRQASLPLLAVSGVFVWLHLFTRALRWRTLLAEVGQRLPTWELFSAVSIGYMASLLPGRVGEVLRPALLSRRTGTPLGRTIATVGVERVLLDLMAVVLLGAVGLLAPRTLSGLAPNADLELIATLKAVGAVLLAGTVAGVVVVHLVARRPGAAAGWLEGHAERARGAFRAKVYRTFASLVTGLDGFRSVPGTLRLIGETLVVWIVITIGVHLGIIACGVPLSPVATAIMIPILAVGIGVPAPGGTGPYHAAMLLGLTKLFGVPRTDALVAGLVVHAMTWLPVLMAGGYFVARGGLVKSAIEAVEEMPG